LWVGRSEKRKKVTSDKGQVTSLPAGEAGDEGQAKTKSEKLKTKSGNEYKVVGCGLWLLSVVGCDCCGLWLLLWVGRSEKRKKVTSDKGLVKN
jgi:hypothetical protein